MSRLIDEHQPHEAAIEQIFMNQNPQSALKLGQARGAALVAIASKQLSLSEYSPREVKQAVVGYGAAEKKQIQHMIGSLLSLKKTISSDAADALAIALCHANNRTIRQRLKQAEREPEIVTGHSHDYLLSSSCGRRNGGFINSSYRQRRCSFTLWFS